MYTFLFLSIPAVLVFYYVNQKTFKESYSIIFPILIGFFTGLLICIFRELFILNTIIIKNNFAFYLFYNYFEYTFIPLSILIVAYFLISKDNWKYKANTLKPLILAEMICILPYSVYSSNEKHSIFLLIGMPLIVIFMVDLISTIAKNLYQQILFGSKFKITLVIFELIISSLIPALIQSIWYFKLSNTLVICLTILLFLTVNFVKITNFIKNKSIN